MLKNKFIIFFIFALSILLFLSISLFGFNKSGNFSIMILNPSNIRPEVKKYIDDLYFYSPISIEHTTDSIAVTKIRMPENPKPFDAGRYKVIFQKENDKKVIICQTEEIVSHISRVVPGETKIGGYIQILDEPNGNGIGGAGTKLNPDELDYFIQTIYKKFTQPLMDEETMLLNKIKDYALAIMFSGKQGIKEYHNNQIRKLKSIKK